MENTSTSTRASTSTSKLLGKTSRFAPKLALKLAEAQAQSQPQAEAVAQTQALAQEQEQAEASSFTIGFWL